MYDLQEKIERNRFNSIYDNLSELVCIENIYTILFQNLTKRCRFIII
jgi:hypothetical protein